MEMRDWDSVAYPRDIFGDIESLTCGTYMCLDPYVSDSMSPRMSRGNITVSQSGNERGEVGKVVKLSLGELVASCW